MSSQHCLSLGCCALVPCPWLRVSQRSCRVWRRWLDHSGQLAYGIGSLLLSFLLICWLRFRISPLTITWAHWQHHGDGQLFSTYANRNNLICRLSLVHVAYWIRGDTTAAELVFLLVYLPKNLTAVLSMNKPFCLSVHASNQHAPSQQTWF